MNIPETLELKRSEVVYLNDVMRDMLAGDLDDDGKAAFDEGRWLRDALIAEGIELQERYEAIREIEAVDTVRANTATSGDGATGAPAFIRPVEDPYSDEFLRTAGMDDVVKRTIDECSYLERGDGASAKEEITRKVDLTRTDPDHMRGFDQYWRLHSSPAYTRAFFKLVSGQAMSDPLTAEESHAYRTAQAFDLERGITLTAANGGAMIPAHLDPSVVLTNNGQINPLRRISRNVSIMTNVWNGVTSAGVTLAYRTEGGDSADVAATYQSPSITCYRWDGTIPVTVEAEGDIAGLATEVTRELRDALARLEANKFTVGAGSTEPIGVVTALSTETARWSSHATNSAFTVTDLINTQNSLGAGYQANASWLASLTYHNRVRAFGSSSYYTWTQTLDQGFSTAVLGRPAYEASDMTSGLNTVTNYAAVYGDFSGFYIVDRVGIQVEFIPNLFSVGNGLPNGKRGWWCWGRNGSDVVNNTAFVLSVNPGA